MTSDKVAPRSRGGRLGRRVAGVLLAAAMVGAGFWAGRLTMQPQTATNDLPDSNVLVEVTEQTVGRALNFNVAVSQPRRALAANALAGVVTEVRPSGEVAVGDVLYRVAGIPVRAVQGAVPFYRALGPGDKGEDVRQVQNALVALKLLGAADGTYGEGTDRAVRAWQRRLRTPVTGRIELGELVAVPKLPAWLMLDAKALSLGGVLAGGEKIVYGSTGEPSFVLRLGQQQAQMVPQTATVELSHAGHEWRAVIATTKQNEQGETLLHLTAPDGGPVCGADCASVAADGEVYILSRVGVVPPASGPAVPAAAVTTQPDGSASLLVVDAAGTRTPRPVTVRASQNGIAIVDGVRVGERVQVLGDAPVAAQPTPRR